MCNLMHKMLTKTNFCIIIHLCVFLAQGIVGTVLKDNLEDSTNSLIRQKRVINRLPGQDVPYPSSVSTHTVNIKESNKIHCVGTILSLKTVITAARCVFSDLSVYKVLAGSTDSRRGSTHYLTGIRMHGNNLIRGQRFLTGIVLIYVNPPFEPRGNNIATIGLNVGPLLPGMVGMIRGWGSHYFGGRVQTQHKGRQRAIEVPIIHHRDCVDSFRGYFEITDAYFCTHDINKQCGFTDAGAGFIIDNSLAGIYVGHIDTGDNSHLKPDVFIMVQHFEYRPWILRNIEP